MESRTALVRRARAINRTLALTYPDARCELDFGNPLELLVATILSAQSTDRRVNAVTPIIFARYPDAAAYAAADRAELEELIHPTGFFRAKTDSLIKLGTALVERYGGAVPGTLKQLVTLPGVAARPPTWCSATPSVCLASPPTPTSCACRSGSAGPRRLNPSWSKPKWVRCSPARTGRSCRTT